MALTVVFVSGPRRAGKSTIVQELVRECGDGVPHYIRLSAASGDKHPPEKSKLPSDDCGVATAQWLTYQEDRLFEFLPEALSKIHREDRYGRVIIEGDSDPNLRHAYPYDLRIFVIPAPRRVSEIFRNSDQATEAFRAALEDTAVFAREIYGLVDDDSIPDANAPETRSALTAGQLRALMTTPLGDELATRILLQPSHHGLLEADMVVVNTAVGGSTSVVDKCVSRLERVLAHLRRGGREQLLFCCDPVDRHDPMRAKLFARAAELADCNNGEASPLG